MIKFFRHIRQGLVTDSKFSKYLIYAIGEIILVVIGILIALSINNWNQDRLESKKEVMYLENLERDLQNQLASIDIQLDYEQRYIDNGVPIGEKYRADNAIVYDSTLCNRLNILTERKTFVRTDPTFEDLVSTGNIAVLKNNVLRNSLIEYYQELERVEKVIQNNNTLHTDQGYVQSVNELVYVGTHLTDRLLDISAELLKDPEREMKIINLIDMRTIIALGHKDSMLDLKLKTEEMIELIQQKNR